MPQRSWVLPILLCVLGLLSTASAHADTRCEGKLVSEGDPQYQVRNLCGSPDQTSQRVEVRTVRRWVEGRCQMTPRGPVCGAGYFEEVAVQVVVEDWIYDLGPHNLIRFLTFEQGRLIRITTGGYGTKEI